MQYEINFNNCLNEYLNDDNKIENDKTCLISGDVLQDDYITLPCNHKFNYENIYIEIQNQKNKTNTNEIVTLLKNEIKCPYCRNVHKYLLPFNAKYVFNKNIMEVKERSSTCVAILKSGARKGEQCNRKCENLLCYFHRNFIIK
jgi:hypothetical protein